MHSRENLSLVYSGDVPVASNSPTASCVSLLLSKHHLAVAASFSGDSPYRDPFPAVALRELPSFSVVNSGSLEGEAAVFLRAEVRSSFSIEYLSIFHHQHYVYIAVVQFVSYSEVELQCRSEDNSNFPYMTAAYIQGEWCSGKHSENFCERGSQERTQSDVILLSESPLRKTMMVSVSGDFLIGAFSPSPSETRSAICAFSMQRLKLTFWYNIDRCRGGADSIGLPHVGRDAKCINKSRIPLDEETCELGVGGSIEAVEVAVAEVDQKITALSGVVSPRIVLAGTEDGQILQVSRNFHVGLEAVWPVASFVRSSPLDAANLALFLWRHRAIWLAG
ncbi:hypothetical protein ANCDUO_13428 [Ancylostoma duodenale]|uniref:Sema domain-containing protein n=1 Tax=Ancylostoma duodenale TaxID=51022 RepID=A0A0C2GH49_9BILA|nr:hypothetical protein ANCDUO_13428 [Ancylostoma duodenale]